MWARNPIRSFDTTGRAIGFVSNYPIFRELSGLMVKQLALSLYVTDMVPTDNELVLVTSAEPPGIRGSLYQLTRLSREHGVVIEKNKKIKRGKPIPPPFDNRVYFDLECPANSTRCIFKRNTLTWEPVGDPIRLPDATMLRSSFSGRVYTIVYPEKTGPKEWTVQLTNVNCQP